MIGYGTRAASARHIAIRTSLYLPRTPSTSHHSRARSAPHISSLAPAPHLPHCLFGRHEARVLALAGHGVLCRRIAAKAVGRDTGDGRLWLREDLVIPKELG